MFYDVGTNEFAEYVKQKTGYVPKQGFSTDIKVLCHTLCGVNMSVGYYEEHTSDERLVLDQWKNTLQIARNWLSEKDLPTFKQNWNDRFEISHKKESATSVTYFTPKLNVADTVSNVFNRMIYCMIGTCGHRMPESEWFENHFKCTKCNQHNLII